MTDQDKSSKAAPTKRSGRRGRERRRTKTAQVLLVCAGVLFTNVSAWLARELVRELTRDDGSTVQISKCPNEHGKIKSPLCCGADMTCSIA